MDAPRTDLVRLLPGLAFVALGAALFPLVMIGLLAPIPAAVGVALVLLGTVPARGDRAPHPTLGLAAVASAAVLLAFSGLHAIAALGALTSGFGSPGRLAAWCGLFGALGAGAAAWGLRQRGVTSVRRDVLLFLGTVPGALVIFFLLSLVFPTTA